MALTAAEKGRKRRARLAALGLCRDCGLLPPKEGRKSCPACLFDAVERVQRYQRAKRERAGGVA